MQNKQITRKKELYLVNLLVKECFYRILNSKFNNIYMVEKIVIVSKNKTFY